MACPYDLQQGPVIYGDASCATLGSHTPMAIWLYGLQQWPYGPQQWPYGPQQWLYSQQQWL